MPINSHSDEELMALVRDHQSHHAYAELVQRHTSRFYAVAFGQCGSQDEAEDSVQDAFIKLWTKPQMWKSDHKAKFTTWFYRIVVNTAIDHMRKRKNHDGDDKMANLADHTPQADQALVDNQKSSALEAAIQGLPDRQKTALNLCFYDELSNKEASEIMAVSVKGLESLLMRAKKTLRGVFENSEFDQNRTIKNGSEHG
jgi:RNA polymerase sigma-70 factor (ECF subfamily)